MSSERPQNDGPDERPTLEMPAVKREQEQIPLTGWATQSSLFHPERNEDTYFTEEERGMLAVFDGVGGSGGLGEIASRLAKKELSLESLEAAFKAAPNELKATLERMRRVFGTKQKDTPLERHEVEMAMHDMLMHINRQIEDVGSRTPQPKARAHNPMGTTGMVGKAWQTIEGKKFLTLGNSGDSRAYVLRGGRLVRLTRDQSYVQMLIDAHVITNDQDITRTVTTDQILAALDKHPELGRIYEQVKLTENEEVTVEQLRRMVDQYLGLGRYLKQQEDRVFSPDITTTSLETGDVLILTTDGIHDNLLDGEIELIARRFANDPQGLANLLVTEADKASLKNDLRAKPDDMTAVVKRIE